MGRSGALRPFEIRWVCNFSRARGQDTVNGTISAPLSALYNRRPFGAPIFRFIFVGNFFILFFFTKINKSWNFKSANCSKTANCSNFANYSSTAYCSKAKKKKKKKKKKNDLFCKPIVRRPQRTFIFVPFSTWKFFVSTVYQNTTTIKIYYNLKN